ncbi:DUF3987 domain-containing protein [Rhodoferax bucti]|uniref:DUF3987 domain-containing protein n=1 Tax=Rhodoferax bucti TaxID=2576305 RepID=UPI001108BD96|nr:DUF3987 domain-containing protein [Rhodoferax bucti]
MKKTENPIESSTPAVAPLPVVSGVYEIKTPTGDGRAALEAMAAASPVPTYVYSQEQVDDLIVNTLAPNETLWRAFAKPSIHGKFVQAAIDPTRSMVRSMLSVVAGGKWPTLDACIPPGSILDDVDRMFYEGTDIPRELPFFTVIHYIAAMLLQQDVQIEVEGRTTRPDIWTIALAPSGAGKTFTQNVIEEIFGKGVRQFPEAASAAKFVECLRDNNHSLWLRDEFAQYLSSVETQSHMAQVKDFLLRTYDNNDIEHRTKEEDVIVEDPALTIFGTTPFATIKNYLSSESLVDGFAQRFAFVVAERDERRIKPIYRTKARLPQIQEKWAANLATQFHKVYHVDDVGIAAYEEAFYMIVARSGSESIDESFSRRIMWRSLKYALIYHVITGKTDNVLHAEDLTYAARLAALNLRDLRKVLDQYDMPVFNDISKKAKSFVERRAASGLKTSKRDLVAGVRGVGKATEAQEMLEFLADDPALAPHIELAAARKSNSGRSSY